MALTGWVEPDQVVWRGIRWARRGNLLVKYGEATDRSTLIYTVPAGRTFYLVGAVATPLTFGAGDGYAYIRDSADAMWFRLGVFIHVAEASFAPAIFQPASPLEVPEGCDFVASSNRAEQTMTLSFCGWEE